MRSSAFRKVLFVLVLMLPMCCFFRPDVMAIGQERYVASSFARGSFPLVQGNSAAAIYVDSKDWPGVIRAANDLQADIARVTGVKAAIFNDIGRVGKMVILVGTLGKSSVIDQLVRTHKIDAGPIAGKWESFFLQVVPNPLPGVSMALVIVGSDKRGTIYSAQLNSAPVLR